MFDKADAPEIAQGGRTESPSYLDIDPIGFFLAAPLAYTITELADPPSLWWLIMLAALTVVFGFVFGTVIQIQANAAYDRGRTDGIELGRFLQNRDHEWQRQAQHKRWGV